jgi:hypothetical protein
MIVGSYRRKGFPRDRGPDVDALDQSGKEGTLPCCGQLGPAPADFLGSRDQPALC